MRSNFPIAVYSFGIGNYSVLQKGAEMILKKGKRYYKAPPIGQVIGCHLRFGEFDKVLHFISRDSMAKLIITEGSLVGEPVYLYIMDNKITVYPVPDKKYELRLIYYPPAMEA